MFDGRGPLALRLALRHVLLEAESGCLVAELLDGADRWRVSGN